MDFAKPAKAITLPQDVPSTSDRRLIELENQVQCLMKAHLALMQPTQVNKVTTSCEICSGPHNTQYCMEDPKQAFVEYASSRTDEAGGLVSSFMASQDARLSKFEADFKQQHNEITNKIDTLLKAITDRIAGTLPSDTVQNPELSTSLVLSTRSYPTEDPQCSTHVHGPNRNNDGIEWLDVEEPQDLVNTSEESVYESLIKEMPKCSLIYDFWIKKGDPRNLKIPCMIGHKFTANAYIDVDLPMNIMPLSYYNSIRMNGYEYMGRNFVGLGRDMHVFVGNMSYVMDFTILESIENNIDPSLSNVVFGRPFVKIACLAINTKNIMSLAYYNSVRMNGYEYMGRNFVGLGRDMHVFVGNMSYVMDFTILESIENNIDPSLSNVVFGRPFVEIACLAINTKYELITFTDGIKEITFKTPYNDPEVSELSSEDNDLLSSRVILSEDDYDRGCRKPSDLEDGFYRDTLKLGLEYLDGMDDEGEVT
ncbi:hypothetical protein Tco_1359779 [Tanacetum coccineum]